MSDHSCPGCGAALLPAAAFCPSCGKPVPGAVRAEPSAAAPAADLGWQLGGALGAGYEVRGMVGRGGFAEVHEVFDKGLNRRLAVKVLRPDIAWTPGMLNRFKDECRVLASLNHPNILPIHFVGEGQGLTYYVMPYVEGQSLGGQLRSSGPLEVRRALDIAVPILEALGHAHGAGLLHRDIKPDNIMLDAATGRALLVDFGIAKRLDGESGQTQTGFVVGTPQYMSPEQALGQMKLDARSDLYAFGAMLFQMVTGAPPYEGDSSQEIVGKHLADPIPAPSDRNASVPVWLSAIIVRCLAKKAGDRFQSAASLIEALNQGAASGQGPTITAGQIAQRVSGKAAVVTPSPGPRADPVPAPLPRRRSGVVVALAIVLAGAGAGWFLFGRPVVLDLTNRFDGPMSVTVPSGQTIVVPAGATVPLELPSSGFARLPWQVAERRSPDGRPMGHPPAGEIDFRGRRGRNLRSVGPGNERIPMFEPLITNASTVPLGVTVNAGLRGATACGCLVPAGAVRYPVGYYPLYRNTTVRAAGPANRSATFKDLGPRVDRATWKVGLRFEDRDLR